MILSSDKSQRGISLDHRLHQLIPAGAPEENLWRSATKGHGMSINNDRAGAEAVLSSGTKLQTNQSELNHGFWRETILEQRIRPLSQQTSNPGDSGELKAWKRCPDLVPGSPLPGWSEQSLLPLSHSPRGRPLHARLALCEWQTVYRHDWPLFDSLVHDWGAPFKTCHSHPGAPQFHQGIVYHLVRRTCQVVTFVKLVQFQLLLTRTGLTCALPVRDPIMLWSTLGPDAASHLIGCYSSGRAVQHSTTEPPLRAVSRGPYFKPLCCKPGKNQRPQFESTVVSPELITLGTNLS
ncbi:hypothetical protein RRG08_033436 [Elysia crispata]|uniref:Uncharacterized protein n=1 Tax=Elysia crispata TaxID=231223 RepID=A0AAE1E496_9GAST|nr:hypothetical protein RRG08_033436 [Elysia crispata]